MERLEAKRVKGHTYYYYSKWARVDNRCRRVWQRYLGKLEDIVAAVQGGGPAPIAAEVFQWGKSTKPSGRKPPEHNSSISSTATAPNAGKD